MLNINLDKILWFSIFILLTIGDTTTNSVHGELNGILRYFAFLSTLAFFLIKLFLGTFNTKTIILISFQLILICFGFILSTIYGGEKFIDSQNFSYLLLSTIFLFSVLEFNQDKTSMTAYIVLAILLALFSGGLSFDPLPTLDLIMEPGELRDYSQGITSIFGAFALFMYSDFLKKKSILKLLLFILCFMISILGAARGDFIAVFLLFMYMSLRHSPVITIIASGSFLLLVLLTIDLESLLQGLLLLERFSQLGGGNLGMRDIFFSNSFDLIINSSNVLLGHGFNYFQIFFDYDYGSYPHNILLELVISFGFIGFLLAAFSLIGFLINLKNLDQTKVVFMMLMYIIFMKSGNLLNFFALPIILYFSFDAIQFILSRLGRKKKIIH